MSELLEELAMHDLWRAADHTASSGGGDSGGIADGSGLESGADAAAIAAARGRYAPYSVSQREALRGVVERFLTSGGGGGDEEGGGDGGGGGDVAALGIDSMRRLQEVLHACRVS